ncbi:MAG TPA: hypothetical protein VG916_08690, partial [Gemmatimonadaceae bacterium]|nr:hypothetical protein [Gemmatimonadaceae bacterium]
PELERMLRSFEPFGVGNPGPTFTARGVRLAAAASCIGADGLKFTVQTPAGPVEAVGWGLGPRVAELRAGAVVDLAYRLERNAFRGADRLQFNVIDFRQRAAAAAA